ncbi:MAG: TonB-dependent siderophore receptor [Panacagrimonas sp.]
MKPISTEPTKPAPQRGFHCPRDTPQSVTVVTRQRMDDQQLQSLRDVLDNTTGVYSYAYDTERVVFTARGFFIDSLMYDGVPAAENFGTSSTDETLDMALYERVEIVRGATGLLTGAGSPSASVNLVRKHADSKELSAEAELQTGSWNDQRAVLDVSAPLTASGNIRGRFVGAYQHKESFQDFYENEKQVLYGIVDADLGPDTQISLGVDYQEVQPQSNTWGSFPLFLADGSLANWRRSITTSTDWAFWNKRTQTAFAEARHSFADTWFVQATATHRTRDDNLALFYVFGYPDPDDGTGLVPFAFRDIGEIKQDSLDIYASGPFSLLGRQHELVAGFNAARKEVIGTVFPEETLAEVGNFFEWDGSYPMPVFGEGVLEADVDQRQTAFYVASRLQLADPLKLVAGARHTRWKTDFFYVYDGTFEHDHSDTTPYTGLIYDFSDNFSAFVSYTRIFNPQNAQQADGNYLDPIEGNSIETGIKGEHFEGRLNTALTLFDTRQDNIAEPAIDPESGQPILLADGVTQASVAVDGTRTRGFELEVAGSVLPGWNASLGWSRYLLEDGEGDSVKPYIPRTLVRTFTTWDPQGRLAKLTLGAGANWQSGCNLDVGAPDGPVNLSQGSVALLSLMARYQFTPAMSVQVNGNNLLDKTYYVFDEYGNLYYGTPSSVSASLSYRF